MHRSYLYFCFYFLLFFIFSNLTLTSCGFHLRGTEKLPPILHRVYVEKDARAPQVIPALLEDLRNQGVVVLNTPETATSILSIQNFQQTKQLNTLIGVVGAAKYQLITSVEFTLSTPDGKILMGPETLSIQRLYSSNNLQILSDQAEQNELYYQMAQALARKILMRLSQIKMINN